MLPIKKRISKFNYSNGNTKQYIVMHDTGNYKDTAADNANYFNNGNRSASAHYFVGENSIWQVVEDWNASWHCGDGHGRYGITNHNSIGIEMCNSGGYISEKTIGNTLELVKYLMNKYNIPASRVVRHYDASRKICPNNMSANNWTKWWEFKKSLGNTKLENSNCKVPTFRNKKLWQVSINGEIVKELQSELNKQFNAHLKVDGYFGDSTLNKCVTVHRGARGNISKIIQQRLISCGAKNIVANGVFQDGTYGALRTFQKQKGLSVDGICGRNTWKELFKK